MTSTGNRVGRLASISLDCADPAALAEFYAALLGLSPIYAAADGSVIALSDGGVAVTMMRVADYLAPTWPDPELPKQLHLDVAVTDLDAAVAAAIALGAVLAERQPLPELFRVLLDPAGHPFCVTIAVP